MCTIKIKEYRTSLVVQRLKICLPMQRDTVHSWSGRIPCATGQLSLCATTTEA